MLSTYPCAELGCFLYSSPTKLDYRETSKTPKSKSARTGCIQAPLKHVELGVLKVLHAELQEAGRTNSSDQNMQEAVISSNLNIFQVWDSITYHVNKNSASIDTAKSV